MSLHHRLPKDVLVMLVETIEQDTIDRYKDNETKYNLIMERNDVSQYVETFTCYLCKKWTMKIAKWYSCSTVPKWITASSSRSLYRTNSDMVILTCKSCRQQVCKNCAQAFTVDPDFYALCVKCAQLKKTDTSSLDLTTEPVTE
jgi:hypothetical protein